MSNLLEWIDSGVKASMDDDLRAREREQSRLARCAAVKSLKANAGWIVFEGEEVLEQEVLEAFPPVEVFPPVFRAQIRRLGFSSSGESEDSALTDLADQIHAQTRHLATTLTHQLSDEARKQKQLLLGSINLMGSTGIVEPDSETTYIAGWVERVSDGSGTPTYLLREDCGETGSAPPRYPFKPGTRLKVGAYVCAMVSRRDGYMVEGTYDKVKLPTSGERADQLSSRIRSGEFEVKVEHPKPLQPNYTTDQWYAHQDQLVAAEVAIHTAFESFKKEALSTLGFTAGPQAEAAWGMVWDPEGTGSRYFLHYTNLDLLVDLARLMELS